MTVKRKRDCNRSVDRGRNSREPVECQTAAAPRKKSKAPNHESTETSAYWNDGMCEPQVGALNFFQGKEAARRDRTKEKAIAAAYRRSKTLRQAQPALRQRWSILREERLATVFGTYVRGEDVFKIDLAAIVNVDEWLERHAALALAQAGKKIVEVQEHRDQIDWIESQMADYPAQSIFGVICKLMIWRRKNIDLPASDRAEGETHRLACSAYGDLLRLTGFLSIACDEDRLEGFL
ncbi:MAG: hypothetical protein H6923_05250 [Alphaproteobacteria bacterium]|nr:hypothetical protein [Alphaproteobacteria bacterium]